MKGNNAMKGKLKAIWKRAVSGMLAAITVMSTVAVTPVFAAGNTATKSHSLCVTWMMQKKNWKIMKDSGRRFLQN